MTDPAFLGKRRWIMLVALLCASCASVHTKTPEGEPVIMDEAEFARYFEQVFRHHNNVVNESLFAVIPNAGEEPGLAAEKNMRHACQPLNDVASAAATGETPDFTTKMKLLDAVPACEAATRQLEKVLSTGQ